MAEYNSLPDLDQAQAKLVKACYPQRVEELVNQIGIADIFNQFGVRPEDCLLWLPHRHHELLAGQFIVEEVYLSAASHGDIISQAMPKYCSTEDLVANKFTLSVSGENYVLTEQEYVQMKTPVGWHAKEMFDKVISQPGFLGALGSALASANLVGVIGLGIGLPGGQERKFGNLVEEETTDESGKSIVRLVRAYDVTLDEDEPSIAAAWTAAGTKQRGCQVTRRCVLATGQNGVKEHRTVDVHRTYYERFGSDSASTPIFGSKVVLLMGNTSANNV